MTLLVTESREQLARESNRYPIAEATDDMIVHHSYGLHKGVADGRSNEVEAAALEIFAHRIGIRSLCLEVLG